MSGVLALAGAAVGGAYILMPSIVTLAGDPLLKERRTSRIFVDAPPGDCTAQHEKYVGGSTSDLLDRDFQIKAAVPGGIWLQKGRELFYCNSGVVADNDTMCWRIAQPVRGVDCKAVRDAATARRVGG